MSLPLGSGAEMVLCATFLAFDAALAIWLWSHSLVAFWLIPVTAIVVLAAELRYRQAQRSEERHYVAQASA